MSWKLLFICSGNTCRSPLAAALARQVFGGEVEARSAGLAAWEGQTASEHAVQVAGEYGESLLNHRAEPVRAELLQEADWIIPMTKSQQEHLIRLYPQYTGKIKYLGAWADNRDVQDPWGGSLEKYRQTASQIKVMLLCMKEQLANS